MNSRSLIFFALISVGFGDELRGGIDQQIASDDALTTPAYRFAGELRVEQSYVGGSDVQRGDLAANDFDELYSLARFVYTPRTRLGIIRVGAEFERYSFGFAQTGQQLPNTLQAMSAVIGFDTEFSDSILVRLEAQPGIYGASFDRIAGNQFNVPFLLGGTYIYSPELQFVLGIGVNFEQKYPVLPGGGIRWKFAPQWVLNAVLPTPRLEYDLNRSVKLFTGAEIKASTFRVGRNFGDSHAEAALNNAWLSYEEIRTGAGLEFNFNSSLTFSMEGGFLPYRDLDYFRTDARYHSESGAGYATVSFQGNF